MIHCFAQTVLDDKKTPLNREQFSSLVFGPIEGTPVDAVFFSFGSGNVAEYDSEVLEWPGEADRFEFPKDARWHGGVEVDPKFQYLNPKALADAGHNPPAVVVEECHRRGLDAFVSLRMNDCHDGQHAKGGLPNPEFATFKRRNPQLLVADLDWWSALNFAEPRVRRLKLKVISEFFERWDFDGIELDWLRHTLYFPRGTERGSARHLTEFVRETRRLLDDVAKRRGRPIELAVRIPERVEWCLEGGFDVPTWIAEDLVDLLILGQGMTRAPRLESFRKLMSKRELPIYPSLYSYGNGYRVAPDEVIRANAANLWRDGADGLYTFNWFFHDGWRRDVLREIATPKTLSGKSKHYTLDHRFEVAGGDPGRDFVRYNTAVKDAPVPFLLNQASREETVVVPVAELPSSSESSVELWLAVEHLLSGDILALEVNGVQLKPVMFGTDARLEKMGSVVTVPEGSGLLGFPVEASIDMQFDGLRITVPAEHLVVGLNKIHFQLEKRAPGAEFPLRVTRVELRVA